jgi:hypothetical protein
MSMLELKYHPWVAQAEKNITIQDIQEIRNEMSYLHQQIVSEQE